MDLRAYHWYNWLMRAVNFDERICNLKRHTFRSTAAHSIYTSLTGAMNPLHDKYLRFSIGCSAAGSEAYVKRSLS